LQIKVTTVSFTSSRRGFSWKIRMFKASIQRIWSNKSRVHHYQNRLAYSLMRSTDGCFPKRTTNLPHKKSDRNWPSSINAVNTNFSTRNISSFLVGLISQWLQSLLTKSRLNSHLISRRSNLTSSRPLKDTKGLTEKTILIQGRRDLKE
jgi:hypothetical protein